MRIMKKFLIILLILCLVWAIIEPNLLVVKKYLICDKDLRDLRIVLISDLHLNKNQNKKLSKIVDRINNLNPEIVFITGDFICNAINNVSMNEHDIAQGLSKIKSSYGVFAVLGNHDYLKQELILVDELNNVGIKVLRNSNEFIETKGIYIAGIDDNTSSFPDIEKALNNTFCPRILLMHSPDFYESLRSHINLVVCGHNHGGQINIPFIGPLFVPAKTGRKYLYGFYDDIYKKMIVTKGIGNSILNVRFNCLPEIVLIEFY